MKMSRKAVFFDADGTVCDMKKGVKHGSAQEEAGLLSPGIWSRFLLPE